MCPGLMWLQLLLVHDVVYNLLLPYAAVHGCVYMGGCDCVHVEECVVIYMEVL